MPTASSVSVSVPIWLTLTRIELATPAPMPRSRRSVLVTKRSSPTSCTRSPSALGERRPAVPVLLGHAVLDRDDRVARRRGRPGTSTISAGVSVRRPRRRARRSPSSKNSVEAGVEGEGDVVARACSRLSRWPRPGAATASSLEARSGAKPPSSPTAVDRPRLVQELLQGVVGLGAPAQGLGERGRADRHDHELLEVDVVVGVGAAVEHVHHRHRQHVGVGAADVAVERQLELVGRGLGHGQRHAEDGVGAEAGLVVGAVEVDRAAGRRRAGRGRRGPSSSVGRSRR